jgi:uncharacterized membrane protein YdfJ with MMPL/SSD domain
VVSTRAVTAYALGASVLIWQHLLGHDLHWSLAPISFIALVAVGADYNLLLAMRIREEAPAGLSTGIVRAFALPSLIALLGRLLWWPSRVRFLARGHRVNGLGGQRLRDDLGDLLDRGRAGSLRES